LWITMANSFTFFEVELSSFCLLNESQEVKINTEIINRNTFLIIWFLIFKYIQFKMEN